MNIRGLDSENYSRILQNLLNQILDFDMIFDVMLDILSPVFLVQARKCKNSKNSNENSKRNS
jgi:hypothetical protein